MKFSYDFRMIFIMCATWVGVARIIVQKAPQPVAKTKIEIFQKKNGEICIWIGCSISYGKI